MNLPLVGQRFFLTVGMELIDDTQDQEPWQLDQATPWSEADADDENSGSIVTEVTVLARDLDEGIWTVWDHSAQRLRMVVFDENSNWRWQEPTDDVVNDEN